MVCVLHVQRCEELRDRPAEQDWPDKPDDRQDFPIPGDDSRWDVFIPDDDEIDPLPEPGDFWIEPEDEWGTGSMERRARSMECGAIESKLLPVATATCY